MDILEAGLKEVRGILESDLREIKMKVEQMQSSSSEAGTSQTADLNDLRDQMEKLSDMLAMTNRRMERTLEIASDTEFRLLRLGKAYANIASTWWRVMPPPLWFSKIPLALAKRRRCRCHAMSIPVFQAGLLKRAR